MEKTLSHVREQHLVLVDLKKAYDGVPVLRGLAEDRDDILFIMEKLTEEYSDWGKGKFEQGKVHAGW